MNPATNLESAPQVRVRRSARAARIRLRIDTARGDAELVLPQAAALADGERFVARNRAWLARHLAALPSRRPFADGARVPFQGRELVIAHRPDGPRAARIDGGALVVGGPAGQISARVRAWFGAAAHEALREAATRHAAALGAGFATLRVGDPKTRWGSCSARGALSFSWRLILAPASVLDYVAAHEVAHLREPNHRPAFWRLVERLDPDYAEARAWLKRRGAELHRYG